MGVKFEDVFVGLQLAVPKPQRLSSLRAAQDPRSLYDEAWAK